MREFVSETQNKNYNMMVGWFLLVNSPPYVVNHKIIILHFIKIKLAIHEEENWKEYFVNIKVRFN